MYIRDYGTWPAVLYSGVSRVVVPAASLRARVIIAKTIADRSVSITRTIAVRGPPAFKQRKCLKPKSRIAAFFFSKSAPALKSYATCIRAVTHSSVCDR